MKISLDKVIKGGLYVLILLTPVFFLPGAVFPVALSKQIFLTAIALIVFILWMVQAMMLGSLKIRTGKFFVAFTLFLVILGISTVFSESRTQSFWGMSVEPDTLFSFLLYGLVFYLTANILTKKEEILRGLMSFVYSGVILSVLFLIHSVFGSMFPWGFTRVAGFNPVGSPQALAIFLGGTFVVFLAILNFIPKKQWLPQKVEAKAISQKLDLSLKLGLGILLFLPVLLINYWVAWLAISFGMLLVMFGALGLLEAPARIEDEKARKIAVNEEMKKFVVPVLVLVVALVFIFVRIPFGRILSLPPFVTPSYRATFDIVKKTLAAGPKNLILGSGPATFGQNYTLYKSAALNPTNFWGVRFNQGTAILPTFVADFGILGILAILAIMAIFFYNGFRGLGHLSSYINTERVVHSVKAVRGSRSTLKREQTVAPDSAKEKDVGIIRSCAFIGGFYFFISWFFYPAVFSLIFASFLMLGFWAASGGADVLGRQKIAIREFSFIHSPQKTFLIMLAVVILITGLLIGGYKVSQRYVGSLIYNGALKSLNVKEPNLDKAMADINKAAMLARKDFYFRNLSQIILLKINDILKNKQLSQQQKQKQLPRLASNAEVAAIQATQVVPSDSRNWLQLGNVYENLILFMQGAGQAAISSYKKAAKLDPQNPQLDLNIARVYFTTAIGNKQAIAGLDKSQASAEQKKTQKEQLQKLYSQNLNSALENLRKSLTKKANFWPAYYLRAQLYEIQGKKDLALQDYWTVSQLNPGDEQVKKKIDALRSSQEPASVSPKPNKEVPKKKGTPKTPKGQ